MVLDYEKEGLAGEVAPTNCDLPQGRPIDATRRSIQGRVHVPLADVVEAPTGPSVLTVKPCLCESGVAAKSEWSMNGIGTRWACLDNLVVLADPPSQQDPARLKSGLGACVK